MVTCGHRPEGLQTVTKAGPSKPSGPCAVTAGAAVNASPVTCGTSGPAGPLRFARLFRASNSATRAVALQLADGDSRRLDCRLGPRPPGKWCKSAGLEEAQGRAARPPPWFPPLEPPFRGAPHTKAAPRGETHPPMPLVALRAGGTGPLGGFARAKDPGPALKGARPVLDSHEHRSGAGAGLWKYPSAPAGGSPARRRAMHARRGSRGLRAAVTRNAALHWGAK